MVHYNPDITGWYNMDMSHYITNPNNALLMGNPPQKIPYQNYFLESAPSLVIILVVSYHTGNYTGC